MTRFDRSQLKMDGYGFARSLFDKHAVAELIEVVEESVATEEGRGGVRNLLDAPALRELAELARMLEVVDAALGDGAFAVRGMLFDKNDNANWKVPWHQDVTIAVTNRIDVAGYGPWSVKAGVVHVQPPAAVLETMISVRIHLDDCPAENGALRVLPGTHRAGKLSQQETDRCVATIAAVTCEARAGDALIMQPLLIHSSSAASLPRHRRVLHFDYANVELAEGLQWREQHVVKNEMRGVVSESLSSAEEMQVLPLRLAQDRAKLRSG
jgi:hypothetical protein